MKHPSIILLVISFCCLKTTSVVGTQTTAATAAPNFTPDGGCSAWQLLRQTSSMGAITQLGPRTIQECLDYCNDNTQCVAVDIDVNDVPLGCWVHENVNDLDEKYDQIKTNQYVLRQRCSNRPESTCYSPNWSVLTNQSSAGAVQQAGPKSVQECLDYCGLKAPGCIAVEVDFKPWFPTCWLHLSSITSLQSTIQQQPSVNQYRLSTRCVVTAEQAVTCGSHFQCATGDQCVQYTYRCNGIDDCDDGSDEAECICSILDQYQCGSGQCINRNLMCTGQPECWDGTDERDCPHECASKFRCQSGTCVPYIYRCNGVNDCNDASDEHDCMCETMSHNFQCANDVCIDRIKVCNGISDCTDRSDERDCPCDINEFHCTSGSCIPSERRCNVYEDCVDGSDEANCVCDNDEFRCAINQSQCIPQCKVCDGQIDCIDLSDETSCGCQADMFSCTNGQCIAPCKQCNGRNDCADGSDEISCGQIGYVCSATDFWCLSGERCVSPCSRCDGQYDCQDRTDEFNCNCTSGQFRCSNGQCVSLNARCDAFNDCYDTSDESGCPAVVSNSTCSPTTQNLIGYSGTITSPYYPDYYVNNVNCQWRVSASSIDGTVRLVFNYFSTQYADYVRLFDGYNSSAPLIASLSGSVYSSSYTSSQRYMYIVFTSDSSSNSYTGFAATYYTSSMPACSALSRPLTLTNIAGGFTSKFYPSSYSNNEDCRWRIGSPNINGTVRISFTSFYTQSYYDVVRVYDGIDSSAPLIASLSGYMYSTLTYTSTQRYMYITFTTDSSTTDRGFSATYTLITIPPACISSSRPMNVNNTTGFITSPLYPSVYPHNSDCQWILVSPYPNGVIVLTFVAFYTESYSDYVYIYDGANASARLLTSLSGSNYNSYTSSQRYMFVRFTSDSYSAYTGFNATYTSTLPTAACSASTRPENVTLSSGNLSSPGFPNVNYPNNADCRWLIAARSNGQVVRLVFHTFYLWSDDYVYIYDGSSNSSSTRMASLTGYYDVSSVSLVTSQIYMLVTFSSDGSSNSVGFGATYASISPPATTPACSASSRPVNLTGNSGSLSSPLYPTYYTNNADCQWLIVSPSAGTVPLLVFQALRLSPNDNVSIYDGSSASAPLLGTLPRDYYTGYQATQRFMFVRFTSSPSDGNAGFNATYTLITLPPACAASTRPLNLTNSIGTLMSPFFPNTYPSSSNCMWIITSPSASGAVIIDFIYVYISYDHAVSVVDGNSFMSPRIATLLGSRPTPPRGYITSQRNMLVAFTSDSTNYGYSGFNATYMTTDTTNCPSLQFRCTSPRQCIASLKQCDGTCDCGDCSDERNCTCDSQQFTCAANGRCIALCSQCDSRCDCSDCSDENNCPQVASSQCSSLTQNVSAVSGTITSPNYPGLYPNSASCIWRIIAPATDGIVTIRINGFSTESCCDFLSLYNGFNAQSPLLARLAGDYSMTLNYITTQRFMYITFTSDGSVTSSGFSASYTATGSTETTPNGTSFYFTCASNRASIRSCLRCNGLCDCADCSDEVSCNCTSRQIRCPSTDRCVPISSQCDGQCQCSDCADERNCPCASGNYRCSSTNQCLPASYRCDGTAQCLNREDERDCSAVCAAGQKNCLSGWCLLTRAVCQRQLSYYGINCTSNGFWCDGYRDCPDGSDEFNCTSIVTPTTPSPISSTTSPSVVTPRCSLAGQYQCANGFCLSTYSPCTAPWCRSYNFRCDGFADCIDGSDEQNCAGNRTTACRPGQFACRDNVTCLSRNMWCNGITQCPDGSDEADCPCPSSNQNKCANGQCIYSYQRCNGYIDCTDGSDEAQCNCSSGQFRCNNGDCVTVLSHCQGSNFCTDYSDQINCSCGSNQFQCAGSFACISRCKVCDGTNDCSDGSDEASCSSSCNSPSVFRCTSGRCITACKRCDGVSDCPDESDERNCTCPNSQFRCVLDGSCISSCQVCDGGMQCSDGSDEFRCAPVIVAATSVVPGVGLNFIYQGTMFSGGQLYGNNVTRRTSDLRTRNVRGTSWIDADVALPSGNLTRFYLYLAAGDDTHRESGRMWLEIWRPNNVTQFQWQLIWHQQVNSLTQLDSLYTFSVNRFAVRNGDCIGVRFEGNFGLIPFDSNENKRVRFSPSQNQAPNIGQTVVFGSAPLSAQFSLAVLVETGVRPPPRTPASVSPTTTTVSWTTTSSSTCYPGWFQCSPTSSCISPSYRCDGYCYCGDCRDENYCYSNSTQTQSTRAPGFGSTRPLFATSGSTTNAGQPWPVIPTMTTSSPIPPNPRTTLQSGWTSQSWFGLTTTPYTSDQCSSIAQNLPSGNGTFTSPNYPSNYPNYVSCSWRIVAPSAGNTVTLMFTTFETESCCDYVRLYDGFDTTAVLLASLSGTRGSLVSYTTTQRYMYITFTTDNSVTAIGFRATYSTATTPTCSGGQFLCMNPNFCISPYYQCDGVCDCYDCSDEKACVCTANQFQCGSNSSRSCIPLHSRCDSYCQCSDCSDEINCPCEQRGLRCNNGRCYLSTEQCDGVNNCGDYTDELNCTTCSSNQARCAIGLCINSNSWCDGVSDCPDASDELPNCTPRCSNGYFTCNNTRCISNYKSCDGINDCGDFSDETTCGCPTYSSYRCQMGLCLSISTWCDGYRDCPDNTDERPGCNDTCPGYGSRRCSPLQTCIGLSQVCNSVQDCPDDSDEVNCTCSYNQYQCANGRCISIQWLCDGIRDCPLGDDEVSCNTCQSNQFRCRRGTCISAEQRCDGVVQCADTTDESNCVALNTTTNQLYATYRGVNPIFFCADNWTSQISDGFCTVLGATSSVSTSQILVEVNNNTRWFTLASLMASTNGSNVFGVCPSNAAVGLTCAVSNLACGRRSSNLTNFGPYIVNGQWAQRGAWPWQVMMLVDGTFSCGGSLINDQWILTAAHCTVDQYDIKLSASRVTVRLGSILGYGTDSDLVVSSVDRVITHPLYNTRLITNDVGLLRLTRPVTFTETIRPICLPTPNVDLNKFKVCVSTGFGRTSYFEAPASRLLQARMDILPLSDCYDLIAANIDSTQFTLYNNTVICLGPSSGSGISTCKGDSGGPLACQDQQGVWTVIGVTSFGFSYCSSSYDARVPSMVNWIQQTINSNP